MKTRKSWRDCKNGKRSTHHYFQWSLPRVCAWIERCDTFSQELSQTWSLKEINLFGSDLTFSHLFTFLHRLGPFQEAVPRNKNHSQPPQQSLSWDLGTKYWSSSVQVYYSKFCTNGQLHVVIAALAIFLDRVCCLLLKRKCEAAQSVVFGVHVHLKKQFDKTI